MSDSEVLPNQLVIRGCSIREDQNGLICLDDLFSAAKATAGRDPKRWRSLGATKRLEAELLKKVVIADLKAKTGGVSVAYAKRGRGNAGTYAHPLLAAEYAGYLNPKLKLEVLTVWLRYRQGDPTLADEILQRASPAANHWAGMRAMARSKRKSFTDALRDHGVTGKGYPICTNAVYQEILGGSAARVRARLGISSKTSLRDHLEADELSFVAAAEALAADRINDEDRQGNSECAYASRRSAGFIREAIERDKKDRQRRLLPTAPPAIK